MNLEEDLMKCENIKKKCINNNYAEFLYAALCNVVWQPSHLFEIVKGTVWHCSWRHAGGIVADLRGLHECYLDFYCNGNEGYVHPEIKQDLLQLGWKPIEDDSYREQQITIQYRIDNKPTNE